ncbi:hypothetical protein [Streptomyces xantholiticus]|nr:hypothetical protein [Streptomyces xantholiticus]GGW24672.1 hypothetical protein GCM10010381_04880 [Streptomyces xantholiticus]
MITVPETRTTSLADLQQEVLREVTGRGSDAREWHGRNGRQPAEP